MCNKALAIANMPRCDKKLDGILKKILETKLKYFGFAFIFVLQTSIIFRVVKLPLTK
jgi:hypothetical protein